MKNLLTLLLLFLTIPVMAETSFSWNEGNGSLSPDKKLYVQVASGLSKTNKKPSIGIFLFNVENKKARKRSDGGFTVTINKEDIPIFELVFPALPEEQGRGTKFKWNENGFEISFIGIGTRVFKFDLLRRTFSLTFPKIKKDKTLNK